MSNYCVTSTPTIMDGTVVRWYASEDAEKMGRPIISASRNRVTGHGGAITPELFEAAWAAHLTLKRGGDVEHLATHRRRGLFGELEPVDVRRCESGCGCRYGTDDPDRLDCGCDGPCTTVDDDTWAGAR